MVVWSTVVAPLTLVDNVYSHLQASHVEYVRMWSPSNMYIECMEIDPTTGVKIGGVGEEGT